MKGTFFLGADKENNRIWFRIGAVPQSLATSHASAQHVLAFPLYFPCSDIIMSERNPVMNGKIRIIQIINFEKADTACVGFFF